jgi:hypothetical protein
MENNLSNEIFSVELIWNNENSVSYFYNYQHVDYLRIHYKITSEGIGTLKKKSKQNKILKAPYMLNKFDTAFLFLKYYLF